MTPRTKIYVALAVVSLFAAAIIGSSLWSDHKIARLGRELETTKLAAEKSETHARELEKQAAGYKHKIEYLEESLSALSLIANKQDEELKTLDTDTNDARLNVRRARAVRSLESTTAELCAKLAELGRPCDRAERVTDR